MLNFDRAK